MHITNNWSYWNFSRVVIQTSTIMCQHFVAQMFHKICHSTQTHQHLTFLFLLGSRGFARCHTVAAVVLALFSQRPVKRSTMITSLKLHLLNAMHHEYHISLAFFLLIISCLRWPVCFKLLSLNEQFCNILFAQCVDVNFALNFSENDTSVYEQQHLTSWQATVLHEPGMFCYSYQKYQVWILDNLHNCKFTLIKFA